MNKEFIPYEQALALKKLGFDEPCLRTYTWNGFDFDVLTCISDNVTTMEERLNSNNDKYTYSAPLYQQAFRWFREKYGLMGSVCEDVDGNFSLWTNKGNLLLQGKEYKEYKTYEEAELACLNKLIEIVKEK